MKAKLEFLKAALHEKDSSPETELPLREFVVGFNLKLKTNRSRGQDGLISETYSTGV